MRFGDDRDGGAPALGRTLREGLEAFQHRWPGVTSGSQESPVFLMAAGWLPTVPTNAPSTPAANSSITLSDDVPPTEVSLRESDAEAAALEGTDQWAAKRAEIEEPDMMTMSCCCGGGCCDPTASVSSNILGFVERSGTGCGTGTDRYFTFTLSGDFSGCRDVHFSVASSTDPGETLVEPDDFSFYSDSTLTSLGGGEYTIEVGPGSGDEIRVYVASDNDAEPETDEDIQVSILPGQGYETGTTGTDASMTIYDDDHWMIKVERTSPAATIVERNGTAQFAISRVDDGSGRSGDTTYGILVDLAMSGAATQYTDYNLNDAGGYLGLYGDKTVIAEGETSIGVTLTTINDHLKENDKLAELSFQSATSFDPAGGTFGADPANGSASVTILDDDHWVISLEEAEEPGTPHTVIYEEGETSVELTLSRTHEVMTPARDGDTSYDIDVTFGYDGLANADDYTMIDHVAQPGGGVQETPRPGETATFEIQEGQTEKTIEVKAVDDTYIEFLRELLETEVTDATHETESYVIGAANNMELDVGDNDKFALHWAEFEGDLGMVADPASGLSYTGHHWLDNNYNGSIDPGDADQKLPVAYQSGLPVQETARFVGTVDPSYASETLEFYAAVSADPGGGAAGPPAPLASESFQVTAGSGEVVLSSVELMTLADDTARGAFRFCRSYAAAVNGVANALFSRTFQRCDL